jgi:hypothetical protein
MSLPLITTAHADCGLRQPRPPSADQAEPQVLTFLDPAVLVGTKYLDSCTACGRIIEVSKQQAETAARQVGPDLR